ncbi:MAG: hypothetical protein M0R77_02840 [Gammaproteobacteria bacterium]|nr:hypothetical protein [Gammaproteobacteria bacterium]
MSVETFLKEWEQISSVGTRKGGRVYNNVEVRFARTGWDNTVKLQLCISAMPKQGNGTSLLRKAVEMAKTHGVTIRATAQNLTPWKQGSMNKNDITNWMKKNGFKPMFTWPDGFGVEMVTR